MSGTAISKSAIDLVGWLEFSVKLGSAGADVGLAVGNEVLSTQDLSHWFAFSGKHVQLFDADGPVSPLLPAKDEWRKYYIVKYYDQVVFCAPTEYDQWGRPKLNMVEGIPFVMPGEPIYTTELASAAPVRIGAVLQKYPDQVVDAKIVPMDTGGIALTMLPLDVRAGDAIDYSAIDIRMEPMTVLAHPGSFADLSIGPAMIGASDADTGGVGLVMLPPRVMASRIENRHNGAEISLGYPRVEARIGDPLASVIRIRMEPPGAFGADHETAGVAINLPPLTATGVAGWSIAHYQFRVVLPGFVGQVQDDETPVDPDPPEPPDEHTLDVASTAWGDDATYPSHYNMLVSVAEGVDELFGGVVRVLDVESTATGVDELDFVIPVQLESVAVGEDDVLAVAGDLVLHDVAVGDDVLMPQADASMLLESVAVGDGVAEVYIYVEAESVAVGDDAHHVGGTLLLESVAVGEDEDDAQSDSPDALLESVAWGDDELLPQVESFALVDSVAWGDDVALAKNPGAVAWVMNTDTGGVSMYENWEFVDMAVVGGKVFACGPAGLAELGDDTDDGDAIDAVVRTGFLEFGGYDEHGAPKESAQRKRVPGLYIGYHASGVLSATVETYGQGHGVQRYSMQPKPANQPINNRIVPGRGLNARYWRLGIENRRGCDFEVHSMAADVVNSTRRIW